MKSSRRESISGRRGSSFNKIEYSKKAESPKPAFYKPQPDYSVPVNVTGIKQKYKSINKGWQWTLGAIALDMLFICETQNMEDYQNKQQFCI